MTDLRGGDFRDTNRCVLGSLQVSEGREGPIDEVLDVFPSREPVVPESFTSFLFFE